DNGWRAVQPFLDAWAAQPQVQLYEAGKDGPQAGEELLSRDGREWRELNV
ncbi:hypothetical protein, partial [Pseudomonas savastanoi]